MTLRAADTQIFTLLGRLTRPANVVHVGAGTGTGYLHQWHTWDLDQAIVVDADAAKLAWAEADPGQASNRHAITAVVGAGNEQRPFYTAGNPDENSLVPPASLQYIWPGLKPAGQSDVQVQTLDTALENAGIPNPRDNTWLVIDCFCAADVVQGAASLLPACTLVCARVLNTESQPEDELLHTSTLHAVTSILDPQGFRFVHLHPGLNPAAGHAFFVRDWHAHALDLETQASEQHAHQQKQAETLGQEKAALEKTLKELQDAKAGLEQQLDARKKEVEAKVATEKELRQQLEEQQKQVQQITEQKNALHRQLSEQKDAVEQQLAQKEQQLAQKDQQLAQKDQQLTEKDKQYTETATHLKQKNDAAAALTKERDQLKQQVGAAQQAHKQAQEQLDKLRQQIDRANTERDQANARIKELQQQNQNLSMKEQQLQQQTTEATHRQQLLQEELARAEAQIDLIKDLLLREQGLEE